MKKQNIAYYLFRFLLLRHSRIVVVLFLCKKVHHIKFKSSKNIQTFVWHILQNRSMGFCILSTKFSWSFPSMRSNSGIISYHLVRGRSVPLAVNDMSLNYNFIVNNQYIIRIFGENSIVRYHSGILLLLRNDAKASFLYR
jgi:hypothetical protein